MAISKNILRKKLFKSLSDMYAREVPLYNKLLETVQDVNKKVAKENDLKISDEELNNLSSERHGAIRLGKPEELAMMARFFNCLDMQPVNFYNLADAGAKSQPVISTAFRPLKNADHRVFCSLLMTDYFDAETRKRIEDTLKDRKIFSDKLISLIEISDKENGLNEVQSEEFLSEGQKLFGWKGKAKDHELYKTLINKKINIAADIACFPNPHLNHLTPNTLDIELLQSEMKSRLGSEYKNLSHKGMKDTIEGPPARKALVLLRQTSYKALDEQVEFTNPDGSKTTGTHTARFGEVEQRGVAMTPKGRKLYDECIAKAEAVSPKIAAENYSVYLKEYAACFSAIPDSHEELKKQGLAYYRKDNSPVRYEDFLPVSAAGIFASNLNQAGTKSDNITRPAYSKTLLETYMNKSIVESDELYKSEIL